MSDEKTKFINTNDASIKTILGLLFAITIRDANSAGYCAMPGISCARQGMAREF
jgi:hypothetical protein